MGLSPILQLELFDGPGSSGPITVGNIIVPSASSSPIDNIVIPPDPSPANVPVFVLKGKDSSGQQRDANDEESFSAWGSYTPTTSWDFSAVSEGFSRRISDTFESWVGITVTYKPDVALTIDLPSNISIDETRLTDSESIVVGEAYISHENVAPGKVILERGTEDVLSVVWEYWPGGSFVEPQTLEEEIFGDGDSINLFYKLPIV